MDHLLITIGIASIGVYLWARPSLNALGVSLQDSFIAGVLVYALGAVLVWIEGIPHATSIMRIGVAATIAGTLGASIWSVMLRQAIQRRNFWSDIRKLRAHSGDRIVISAGLALSAAVCIWSLFAVLTHDHLRQLLVDAFIYGRQTLGDARIIISTGSEGYFYPGFVKQFRDIFIPILFLAAVLSHGSYRNRFLPYAVLTLAIIAVMMSGHRLILIQFLLCVGFVVILDVFMPATTRFAPAFASIPVFLLLAGSIFLMTNMLGRLDFPLSSPVREPATSAKTAASPALETSRPPDSSVTSQADGPTPQEQTRLSPPPDAAAARPQSDDKPRSAASDWNLPRPLVAVIVLAHRAVIAVPRENTVSFQVWGPQAPVMGRGWWDDLQGVRPGMQRQLSNELAEANSYGPLGNSPLAFAADAYYNWGMPGVLIIAAIGSLLLLLLDLYLSSSGSPLLWGAKIFMLFAIPLMYTPFLFLLYGGAAVLALAAFVLLFRRLAPTAFAPLQNRDS